jgi:hypothetical protein
MTPNSTEFAAKSYSNTTPPTRPSRKMFCLPLSQSRNRQKARSFKLRAALALGKLYQSTGRPIGAHGVLGPALEGFSATPEFP